MGFMINWSQKLKLKTKNQNIFFGVNENSTNFLYILNRENSQNFINKKIGFSFWFQLIQRIDH